MDISAGTQDLDGRTVKLLDWYMDFTPTAAARGRVGQFKVPFGRQELVSDQRLQQTSRAIASDFFAPGRDRGVMFHGGTDTQIVQYKVGVFNGTGLAQAQNIDKSLALRGAPDGDVVWALPRHRGRGRSAAVTEDARSRPASPGTSPRTPPFGSIRKSPRATSGRRGSRETSASSSSSAPISSWSTT